MNTINVPSADVVTQRLHRMGDENAKLIPDYQPEGLDGAPCVAWQTTEPDLVAAAIRLEFWTADPDALINALRTDTIYTSGATASYVYALGWQLTA